MENSSCKWLATVASIWIQCSSGSSYAFGIYSPILKISQDYDQSTLDSIAVFKDIGANAGLLSGLLYTAVTLRPRSSSSSATSSSWVSRFGGPWIVLTAGAVQCFIGYFFMWLAVTGIISRPPVPLMCLFMFLAAHAQTFFNTANVVTAVQNFPDYSGTTVGIMKGFLGLSGAILIQVYQAIFVDNPSSFLLMLALLPTLVPLSLMFLVRTHRTKANDEKKHLNSFSIIALIIAAYLMVIIILENVSTLELPIRIVSFSILLVALISPLSIAFIARSRDPPYLPLEASRLLEDQHRLKPENVYKSLDPSTASTTCLESATETTPLAIDKRTTLRGEDMNLLQAMQRADFWLLFLAMACGMGSGLATVNNISQIGGSLGYTSVETSTLVSLWSIWNFLGRFGAGYISDYFLHWKGWARPIFMAITLATMSIGHAVIASGLPGALYAGSILVGVCYGSQWSLMPTITSEIFGVAHMGTIFNTIAVASPIGSYILSVRVVGYIYDVEAAVDDDGTVCRGAHCFMVSFLIMAVVSILGFLIALVLFFRTRRFYKQVIYGRLQHSLRQ